MTTTTPALELLAGNPTDLHDLLDRAGRDLHRNLHSGYRTGFERDLTAILLGYHLPAEDQQRKQGIEAALTNLVRDRMHNLVGVDCLLDDTEESSYDTAAAMADTLLAAIRTQGRQSRALEELVVDKLVDRARCSGSNCAFAESAAPNPPSRETPHMKHTDLYQEQHEVNVMADKETGQRTVHYDLDMYTPAQARALAADLLLAAAVAEQPVGPLAPAQS